MKAPRYTRRELPPYRHLPGKTPHPEKSALGHSYGRSEESAPLDPDRWHESEAYLYGVDLFNSGYFWEAHAAWESVWKATERGSLVREFLEGLIQVAAALVKRRAGSEAGAKRLLAKGLPKLGHVAGALSPLPDGSGPREPMDSAPRFAGVDVSDFISRVRSAGAALSPSATGVGPRRGKEMWPHELIENTEHTALLILK